MLKDKLFRIRYTLCAGFAWILGFSSAYGVSITGTVLDTITQFPIDSAQVQIICENPQFRDTVYTDMTGNWSYTFTPPSVEDDPGLPESFALYQNYPNPFNPSTLIPFSVAGSGEVQIVVYNVLGQKIDERKQFLGAGDYAIRWESPGSAGVYFYRLITKQASITRKMVQLDGGWGSGLSEMMSRNGSDEESSQNSDIPLTLVVSKFGYVPDTLAVLVSEGGHFYTFIETIHSRATLIDLHNDVLFYVAERDYHLGERYDHNDTDIPRLQEGGVDVVFLAINLFTPRYSDNFYQTAMEWVEAMRTELELNADDIQQARTPSEALSINANGKIAAVMAIEGGHTIENSIEKLISLYDEGMRYMTITWNNSTDWAVSAEDERSSTVGLSDFGERVIEVMDSLGVMIDVSHTGIKTIQDILEITQNPIIASHSGVRALNDHYRNLYDDQIVGSDTLGQFDEATEVRVAR